MSPCSYRFSAVNDLFVRNRAIFVALFSIVGARLLTSNTAVEGVLNTLGRPTLLSILGSHMFFNLKEAAEHGVNIGTNWTSYTHSAIRFDKPRGGEDQ